MRRSRESLQSYQQGNDEEDNDAQQDDDEAQYDDEADDDDEEQQYEDEEEQDDEDDVEEDGDEEDDDANESVEQQDEAEEEEEQYAEKDEDEDGLNDTKELEEEDHYQQQPQHSQQQPATADDEPTHPTTAQSAPLFPAFSFTPAAPTSTSASSSSFSTTSSTTPFTFAPSTSTSSTSFSAFPASSSFSLAGTTKAAPSFGSTTAITPFSFSANLSSSSMASSTGFSLPFAASSAASSSAASMSSFTFPLASSSTSASSTPFSFPSLSQPPTTTASAAAPLGRSSAASATSSFTSASVSTTAAGSIIRVPLSTQSVGAVWSPSDDLLFYPSNPASSASSRNNQPAASPAASDLSLFRWPPIYGETSTLLHAWHAVFTSTQRQAAERAASRQRAESMEWRLVVLSQSHCYRAELEACLYRAVQSLSSTAVASELKRAGVSESEYHSHLRVLESVSSTWHLFELLYLDPHDNLTVQLTDWMQRSYLAPSLDGLAADSDEWWEAVLGLLVQGRLTAVVDALNAAEAQLLQFVSADVWQQLLELIETLPSLTAHATSVTQLVALVRDYRLAVQRLASSSAALMSHPFLPYLLAVLAGDEQALATISPTWMQLLVARLIFNQPHTTKADIPQLVTQCVQQLDEKDKADSSGGASAAAERKAAEGGRMLDALREHVLCFRVHSAVLLADQMFDMPYFTAHLVDLLHHAALMPTLQDDATNGKGTAGKRNNALIAQQQSAADKLGAMTPRDYYVLQYVQSIIAHERLWTLTPEYIQSLTTPAVQPVQALCTLLVKQPCSSHAQLSQLQAMAARLQLPALVGRQLALRLGNRMLRAGELGTAVAVYQRGGEEGKERVRQIARKLLFALIKGDGDADSATSELTTAMECVLDNVSEEWLDEERGSVDLLLLHHWADYTTITRHLHSPPSQQAAKQPPQPHPALNVFQADQSRPAEAAVSMEDGVEGEVVGGLLQDAVTLVTSLLSEPLVVPSAGGAAVVYTPQCFHLPLLVRLCALLRRVEAGRLGCELSAGSVRDVLHALSRCELSWQWEEWKAEAGVTEADVSEMRRTLLHWLQTTSMAEESAKRISVRV